MNFTVVFKEGNWLPRSTRQFKGQARSVTADSAASQDCVVRFALTIRAQTWFSRQNKDEQLNTLILKYSGKYSFFELIELIDKSKKIFLFLLKLEEQTHVRVHQTPLMSTTILLLVLKCAICQENSLCKI